MVWSTCLLEHFLSRAECLPVEAPGTASVHVLAKNQSIPTLQRFKMDGQSTEWARIGKTEDRGEVKGTHRVQRNISWSFYSITNNNNIHKIIPNK